MTKNEIKTLVEYLKTNLQNTVSSNNPTDEEAMFIYSELARTCINEVSCIASEKALYKKG